MQGKKELQRLLDQETRRSNGLSVSGFWEYLNGSSSTEQEDVLREEVAKLKVCEALPLTIPDRTPWLKGSATWDEHHASVLLERVEQSPTAVLFREPGEVTDEGSTHPSPSRRLLFLWRNRGSYPARAN